MDEGGVVFGRRPVLVLERVDPRRLPDFEVHGRALCVACPEWVWLGDQSVVVVADGQADPICLECAIRLFPDANAEYAGRVEDQRVDGPHE
jgi:hypothetical protein